MRLQNSSAFTPGFGHSTKVSSSNLNPSPLRPYSFGSSQPYTSLNPFTETLCKTTPVPSLFGSCFTETLGKTTPGPSLFGSCKPNAISDKGSSLFSSSTSTPSSSVFSQPNTSSLYPSAQESNLFGSSKSAPNSTSLFSSSQPSASLFSSSKSPNSNTFTQSSGLFSSSQPNTSSNPLGSQDSNLPSSSQPLGTPEPTQSPSSEDSDSNS
mmetsp:Transcript_5193/g.7802  ORF Transcript_5193/g.7802 Transcript_5193/m.7802 type:complete len:210 (+) Transcript_5193:429-1058(+)